MEIYKGELYDEGLFISKGRLLTLKTLHQYMKLHYSGLMLPTFQKMPSLVPKNSPVYGHFPHKFTSPDLSSTSHNLLSSSWSYSRHMLKSRKQGQPLSPPEPLSESTKGIFGFTEIAFHASEKTNRVSLPRIGSVMSLTSAPTSRPTISQQLFKTTTPGRMTQGKKERVTKSQHILSFERLEQDIQT